MAIEVKIAARVPLGIALEGSWSSPDLFEPASIPVHALKNKLVNEKKS